jgi:hypothetical protein
MAAAKDDLAILPFTGGTKMAMERLADKSIGASVKNILFRSDAWENSRIYAGLRLGASPRFYGLSQDIGGGQAETGVSFETALQVSAYLLSRFGIEAALQTELWFDTDTVSYSGSDDRGDFTASFASSVLEIPLLAKLSYRSSNRFVVSLFTGPYFSIPLGKLEYTSGGGTNSYNFNVPAGWLVGVAPGIRLGSGTLFADIRYGGDFGKTSISDDKGVLSVYSRAMLSFTLGYELGFIKRRAQSAPKTPYAAANAGGVEGSLLRAAHDIMKGLEPNSRFAIVYVTASDKEVAEFITEELESIMIGKGFRLFDRRALDRIRKEQDFQLSGEVDDEKAVSVGKLAGVEVIITGAVTGSGDLRRLRLRALRVEDGEVLAAPSVKY